eukprot:gene6469-5261_t
MMFDNDGNESDGAPTSGRCVNICIIACGSLAALCCLVATSISLNVSIKKHAEEPWCSYSPL